MRVSSALLAAADGEDEDETAGLAVECCGGGGAVDVWQLWDLTRPLEGSCKLQLLKFDAAEARHVFWHSSAHILGVYFRLPRLLPCPGSFLALFHLLPGLLQPPVSPIRYWAVSPSPHM